MFEHMFTEFRLTSNSFAIGMAIGANYKLVDDPTRMFRKKNVKITHLSGVVLYPPSIKSSNVIVRYFSSTDSKPSLS